MEEIKLNNTSTSVKKKNYGAGILITLIVLISIIFVSLFISSGSKPKIEVLSAEMSVSYNEYLGYSATISGVAKNATNNEYSYASIEFSVYDAAGNNLGTALANINNLSGGDSWRFQAVLLDFPDSKPVSFKLTDITVW